MFISAFPSFKKALSTAYNGSW